MAGLRQATADDLPRLEALAAPQPPQPHRRGPLADDRRRPPRRWSRHRRGARACAEYAFGHLGLHRLEAETYGFNTAAIRTFTRAGFVHEGTRRAAYDRNGAWQDGVCFGLLADDPKEPT